MFTSAKRVVKFAFQNFWRNIWLSVITVTMLALTMIVVNIVIGLNVMGKAAVRQIEQKIDVTVSFKPRTSELIAGEVRSYLANSPQVVSIEMVSSEEALAAFRERHKNDPDILHSLEEVGENPFGPALVIRARSPADYAFLLEALENPTFSEQIETKQFVDHETLIAGITRVTDRLKEFGVVLASIFAIIAILIIFNTIRVAIYTYREEVGIMKLVGASNWFVRAPFLLESVIYSLLAAGLAAVVVYPVVFFIEPGLVRFMDGADIGLADFFVENWIWVFGSQFLALVAISSISTAAAMGRYLRV